MKTVHQTLLEGVALVLIGCAVSLAANSVRPRGLDLGRTYFKEPPPLRAPPRMETARTFADPGEQATDKPQPDEPETQFVGPGVVELTLEQASSCFHLCEHVSGKSEARILFIDARNDEDYAEGHIPGAILLDHYHMDDYIADVLPAIESAEQVVIYCNGVECEDGALVVLDLIEEGVPAEKLCLFTGGWEAWSQAGLTCAREKQ